MRGFFYHDSYESKMNKAAVLAWLERTGSKKTADGLARYGLPTEGAFGVSVGALRDQAKKIGKDHELALRLWDSGSWEARVLATLIDDPAKVTPAQMEKWCRDFDSWGAVDSACFTLFDRSPHAWKKIAPWIKRRDEFQKRAGFVLIASLAAHDKVATDAAFLKFLPMIEKGAGDERNFVKKGVSWALRGIGHRNHRLHAASIALARRLAQSEDRTKRWIGKDVLRDLTRPLVVRKVSARSR
jgi:3-methyladenine DNA glycosylase AlkD